MEHNQAVDGLVTLFTKASRDLSMVHYKLEREFQQLYPDNANPMKLVGRLKRMEDEMFSLKEQCCQLLAAKQELIDKAKTLLVGNRTQIQRLQTSIGVAVTSDAGDPAYASFNQVIDEWEGQVKSRPGVEEEPDSDDINQLLFSTIVQDN